VINSNSSGGNDGNNSINRVDLHTHSTASDGLYAPAELVRLASLAHLQIIGLADHDSVEGLPEAIEAGKPLGLEVIPAVEINTDLPNKQGEAHVLGYFVEYGQREFQDTLQVLRDARMVRGERMVEQLRRIGLNITWERVHQLAKGAVGRPHVAQALIEAGYATDIDDAFAKWIAPGRPGYVPRYKLAPNDAVRLIRSAYGVPVLAHPARIAQAASGEAEIVEMVAAGLQGLECYYGDYDDQTVQRLQQLADGLGLIPTGGSDYHGPNMHPTPLGGRYVPQSSVDRLRRQAESNRRQDPPRFELPPVG
jgi:predicted metal-dependent phosphoesterase TrpH